MNPEELQDFDAEAKEAKYPNQDLLEKPRASINKYDEVIQKPLPSKFYIKQYEIPLIGGKMSIPILFELLDLAMIDGKIIVWAVVEPNCLTLKEVEFIVYKDDDEITDSLGLGRYRKTLLDDKAKAYHIFSKGL